MAAVQWLLTKSSIDSFNVRIGKCEYEQIKILPLILLS
jgi:hypothetical protein